MKARCSPGVTLSPSHYNPPMRFIRRDFLKISSGAVTGSCVLGAQAAELRQKAGKREFNASYRDLHLNRVAFPIGGIGAGMMCLEGTGAFSQFSLRNKPDIFNEPCTFAAVSIKGLENGAKVLEGPVPEWKVFGTAGDRQRGRGNKLRLSALQTDGI